MEVWRRNEIDDMREHWPERLAKYTDEEIQRLWESYSESYCAGWLKPTDEDINYVFRAR